jgi:hypothetical protein
VFSLERARAKTSNFNVYTQGFSKVVKVDANTVDIILSGPNPVLLNQLYGQGIDMLTLARNARTSVPMIEKFYASTLDGEMNVTMIQSRRTQKAGA